MKTYTLKVVADDSRFEVSDKCVGFSNLEVLGLLQMHISEVYLKVASLHEKDNSLTSIIKNEERP